MKPHPDRLYCALHIISPTNRAVAKISGLQLFSVGLSPHPGTFIPYSHDQSPLLSAASVIHAPDNYKCLPFKSKRYEMTNHAHVTSICHHHQQTFCTMDVTASAVGVRFPASIKASPNTLHVITFPHLPIKPLYSNTRTLSGDLWE